MRGSGLLGLARGARRPLLGAVVATAVALPALVPAGADASARRVTAPVTIKRVSPVAPARPSAPVPPRPSAPVRHVYGHKLA